MKFNFFLWAEKKKKRWRQPEMTMASPRDELGALNMKDTSQWKGNGGGSDEEWSSLLWWLHKCKPIIIQDGDAET